jgi:hypothetical protein
VRDHHSYVRHKAMGRRHISYAKVVLTQEEYAVRKVTPPRPAPKLIQRARRPQCVACRLSAADCQQPRLPHRGR